MYSAHKLNKQGDNIQPWCTHFLIWNQSVVPFPVLTAASWPAYRFLRRQVKWSGISISFRIFHSLLWPTVKGFGVVNKAEVGEGNGTLLQYSCLENPMDGGAWWATVHGVTKSRTWLSDFTFTFHFYALEKEMATHFSVLAWRIPGTGEPGGLHRVRHDWSDLAAAAAELICNIM